MDPGPLGDLLRKLGQDAIAGLKKIATHSARHLKSKFKIGIEEFKTKIFDNYGVGDADEEYKKSVVYVCDSIYNDLFGNIDMTLFVRDCEESHPYEQYNTRKNADAAIAECLKNNIEAVAEHYKVQIEYVFKMQQLSVHPITSPDELITPTEFDRMIFIIDLMCSPDPISYERGTVKESELRAYKNSKCGSQVQKVATVKYDKRGNPEKYKHKHVMALPKIEFDFMSQEEVAARSAQQHPDVFRRWLKNPTAKKSTSIISKPSRSKPSRPKRSHRKQSLGTPMSLETPPPSPGTPMSLGNSDSNSGSFPPHPPPSRGSPPPPSPRGLKSPGKGGKRITKKTRKNKNKKQ